jgi:hypothetical protein
MGALSSANEPDALKVIQQGEGEGGLALPSERTPLQELIDSEEAAFQKARRYLDGPKKEEAS